jgi:hypothetical protein
VPSGRITLKAQWRSRAGLDYLRRLVLVVIILSDGVLPGLSKGANDEIFLAELLARHVRFGLSLPYR